jgi:hypothetical protein
VLRASSWGLKIFGSNNLLGAEQSGREYAVMERVFNERLSRQGARTDLDALMSPPLTQDMSPTSVNWSTEAIQNDNEPITTKAAKGEPVKLSRKAATGRSYNWRDWRSPTLASNTGN